MCAPFAQKQDVRQSMGKNSIYVCLASINAISPEISVTSLVKPVQDYRFISVPCSCLRNRYLEPRNGPGFFESRCNFRRMRLLMYKVSAVKKLYQKFYHSSNFIPGFFITAAVSFDSMGICQVPYDIINVCFPRKQYERTWQL